MRFTVTSKLTKCVGLNESQDYKMSGYKTHTNRFCCFTGKYKALGLNAPTSQARSVLLRPRALYFPVQHKTG